MFLSVIRGSMRLGPKPPSLRLWLAQAKWENLESVEMPGVALVSVTRGTQSERITENICVQGLELRKGIIKSQNLAFHVWIPWPTNPWQYLRRADKCKVPFRRFIKTFEIQRRFRGSLTWGRIEGQPWEVEYEPSPKMEAPGTHHFPRKSDKETSLKAFLVTTSALKAGAGRWTKATIIVNIESKRKETRHLH